VLLNAGGTPQKKQNGGREDGLDGHEESRGKGIFFLTMLISDALNGSVAVRTNWKADVSEHFCSMRIRLLRTLSDLGVHRNGHLLFLRRLHGSDYAESKPEKPLGAKGADQPVSSEKDGEATNARNTETEPI
jgi:hypothetical protein